MSEDNIFAEVDEDMRREELLKQWDKYGVYLLAAAVFVVLSVGGYKGYNWWQHKLGIESGTAFYQAKNLMIEKKSAEAVVAFSKIAKEGPAGYQTLAKFELAAVEVRKGNKKQAVAYFDEISATGADALLRDYAKIQAATLLVDDVKPEEIKHRVEGLNIDTNPWRYSARELLGLAAFRSGNLAESEKMFGQLVSDPTAPPEISKRAEIMLALLVKSPSPAAVTDGSAPKEATTQQATQ
jgi:hypothetical protein